jgi:hypothetical protein
VDQFRRGVTQDDHFGSNARRRLALGNMGIKLDGSINSTLADFDGSISMVGS